MLKDGQGWWARLRHYADRLADTVESLKDEARAGRSYLTHYQFQDLDDLLSTADVVRLPFGGQTRYVITSDHHRKPPLVAGISLGEGRIATHRALYERALHYYARRGFTLIEAGDIEELWRLGPGALTWIEHWGRISASYRAVYELIREKFIADGRYVRLWGNHDAIWRLEKWRERYLTPILGPAPCHEMALLGDQFLVMHGHCVDRWNNDQRGWWVGRVFAKSPLHTDATTDVRPSPDGTWSNRVGGRQRDDFLARLGRAPWAQRLTRGGRFHWSRAVECDPDYVNWAERLGLTVICGHTHEPALYPVDGEGRPTPYINAGSGVRELQVMEIESDGTVTAVRWSGRGREPLPLRPSAVMSDGDQT